MALISSIAALPWVAAPFAVMASSEASRALSAACRVARVIDSRVVLVSSSELACSEAPLATAWLDEAFWVEAAEDYRTTASATCDMASCKASAVVLRASAILA